MTQALSSHITQFITSDTLWLAVGLIGQAFFSARWIVQWVASERIGRSIMPEVFWYLSFLGGLLVLSYGLHKMDPVLIVGQFGVLIYARNLFFLHKRPAGENLGDSASSLQNPPKMIG